MSISESENAILYKQIGCKIAYYRLLRKKTQKRLAEELCISQSSMNKIEKGCYNRSLSVSTLYMVAKSLNVDLHKLLIFDVEITDFD